MAIALLVCAALGTLFALERHAGLPIALPLLAPRPAVAWTVVVASFLGGVNFGARGAWTPLVCLTVNAFCVYLMTPGGPDSERGLVLVYVVFVPDASAGSLVRRVLSRSP